MTASLKLQPVQSIITKQKIPNTPANVIPSNIALEIIHSTNLIILLTPLSISGGNPPTH